MSEVFKPDQTHDFIHRDVVTIEIDEPSKLKGMIDDYDESFTVVRHEYCNGELGPVRMADVIVQKEPAMIRGTIISNESFIATVSEMVDYLYKNLESTYPNCVISKGDNPSHITIHLREDEQVRIEVERDDYGHFILETQTMLDRGELHDDSHVRLEDGLALWAHLQGYLAQNADVIRPTVHIQVNEHVAYSINESALNWYSVLAGINDSFKDLDTYMIPLIDFEDINVNALAERYGFLEEHTIRQAITSIVKRALSSNSGLSSSILQIDIVRELDSLISQQ